MRTPEKEAQIAEEILADDNWKSPTVQALFALAHAVLAVHGQLERANRIAPNAHVGAGH